MPVTVTATINDTRVRNMLRTKPRQINAALFDATEDASTHLLRIFKTYPTQRSGSGYRRTNTLKRSWKRKVDGRGRLNGIGGRIRVILSSDGNIAPYNRRVQSAQDQARVHRGVWTNTDEAVVQREQRTIVRMYEDRLRIAVR